MYRISLIIFIVVFGLIFENECALQNYSCSVDNVGCNSTDLDDNFKLYAELIMNPNFDTNSKSSDFNILEFYKTFPSVIVPTNSTNSLCKKESLMFLDSLRNTDLWALKMFDSTAKLPSSILRGNIQQYGDFDQCLSVSSESNHIKGKYCLAELDIRLQVGHPLHKVDYDIHAFYAFTSTFQDSTAIFPRFTTINWGICMPASCSAADLESELNFTMDGITTKIRVQEEQCVTKELLDAGVEDSFGKEIAVLFFVIVLTLTILGTFMDKHFQVDENSSVLRRIIHSFSLIQNVKRVLDVKESPNAIKGLDGVRFINMFSLLLVHKAITMLHQPYVNRTAMAEDLSLNRSVAGRTGMYHTDSFLLLSGLLNAHALISDLKKTGSIPIKTRIISRIFRILPNLVAIILFCTYILPDWGSGPQWNLLITQQAELCRKNMWMNFLFIQNYMGFDNICLAHTHQLGTDMQLYLITPFVVWALWKHPKMALTGITIVSVLSAILRVSATIIHELCPLVYFGYPIKEFSILADTSYILPEHRAAPYLLGVVVSYLLQNKKFKLNLSKTQIKYMWTFATCMLLGPMIIPYRITNRNYVYSPYHAALYSTFSPISIGIFASWVILATNQGIGGWFGRFMSSRFFRFCTNISYGMYLTQFPVFFYNIAVLKNPGYYKQASLLDGSEINMIVMSSIVLALLIEYPFLEIRKIIFDKKRKLVNKTENISDSNENEIVCGANIVEANKEE